jgi:hypothetical protein
MPPPCSYSPPLPLPPCSAPALDESIPAAQKDKVQDKVQADFCAAVAAALRDGLAKVTAASAKAGEAHLERALAWYSKAMEVAAAADKERDDKGGEKKVGGLAGRSGVCVCECMCVCEDSLHCKWDGVRRQVFGRGWRVVHCGVLLW